MIKTVPFWTDQVPRPADLPVSPTLPAQVDVAIVGGGYTGLNAARILAQHKTSVAVLERHTIGWGASSRNGGMTTTGLKLGATELFSQYGDRLGHAFWQAALDSIDLIGEIVADEEIDCDFRRNGHIEVAYKPAHFEAMAKQVAWYKEKLNHTVHVVSQADLRSELGTQAFYGGLVDEFSAGLHPAKYVFGLARVVARHGGVLCEETAVNQIEQQPRGFALHTSKGVIQAKEVVLATNGYTDTLIPKVKRRVFPVGSYIIVTEPLPLPLQRELVPKGRMFFDSKHFLNYFRLTPDGRFLWGGRNDLSTDLDLHESARRLQTQMVATFPQLRGIPITHSWTGQLGLTFDLMPHIGRVNGVHYAFGYGGHGVSIATYLGTEMGKLLCGEKTSSPFAEIKHQTMPFYYNRPWFIPFAAMYYRFLDRIM